jgi:alpha-tubulin suppressor-like RCC1 family protein
MVGISACGFHTAALASTGAIWTWGEGKFGRLGHGSERNVPQPKLVDAMKDVSCARVACGGFHTAAITSAGVIYTWGGGEHGQLGHGDKVNKTVPTPITTLDSYEICSITCGWSHTVALSTCGKVWSWGNGDHGKLGHGSTAKM